MELIVHILAGLDLCSLLAFRQVSLAARAVVHSLCEYRQVAAHDLYFLRAMLRRQTQRGMGTDTYDWRVQSFTCRQGMCRVRGLVLVPTYVSVVAMKRCCQHALSAE